MRAVYLKAAMQNQSCDGYHNLFLRFSFNMVELVKKYPANSWLVVRVWFV